MNSLHLPYVETRIARRAVPVVPRRPALHLGLYRTETRVGQGPIDLMTLEPRVRLTRGLAIPPGRLDQTHEIIKRDMREAEPLVTVQRWRVPFNPHIVYLDNWQYSIQGETETRELAPEWEDITSALDFAESLGIAATYPTRDKHHESRIVVPPGITNVETMVPAGSTETPYRLELLAVDNAAFVAASLRLAYFKAIHQPQLLPNEDVY